jgi:hypothetical protein
VPWDLLVKDVPPEHHHDLDYIVSMLDWEANVDPDFAKHRLFHPSPCAGSRDGRGRLLREVGVYSTGYYSAKELTVLPGRSVVIRTPPPTA